MKTKKKLFHTESEVPMRTAETIQAIEKRLLETLQASGLRLTAQRRVICRYLATKETHPTAQQIYEDLKPSFPSLSLATVYNTLEALVELGAVHALGDAGDNTMHYDADIDPHLNLACVRCHRIVDLPLAQLSALEEEAQRLTGYRMLGARIMYYGLCPDCQRETDTPHPEPMTSQAQETQN
ncbi:MAG TPA: transcriptional repressor [Anaerolineaceae bacterium]|nr:transcriptional repressor [Anaerolineaceae bacterium]